jgi:hypothetical protein
VVTDGLMTLTPAMSNAVLACWHVGLSFDVKTLKFPPPYKISITLVVGGVPLPMLFSFSCYQTYCCFSLSPGNEN